MINIKHQLSLPRQYDCKTRKDTKYCITKQGLNTTPHKLNSTAALEQTADEAIGGIYWRRNWFDMLLLYVKHKTWSAHMEAS